MSDKPMYANADPPTAPITADRQQQIDDMVTMYRNGLEESMNWSSADLDPEIREFVEILWRGHVYTLQSCQGGEGHAYPQPTVEFSGNLQEGMRVYAWAMDHGLPVSELRRVWGVQSGELTGPHWAIVFKDTKRR